jgi:hypothetical protein
MGVARDLAGNPAVVAVRFRHAGPDARREPGAPAEGVGAADTPDAGDGLILTVAVHPDRLLRGHLEELAFAVARRHPALAGAELAVGLGSDGGGLSVRLTDEGGRVLARTTVDPAAVDIGWAWEHLRRHGRDPATQLFSLAPDPPPPAAAPGAAGGLLARAAAPGAFLTVRVPALPPLAGGVAEGAGAGELDPRFADPEALPVLLPRGLVAALEADEAAYRARTGPGAWRERAWLGLGHVGWREGTLTAAVERLVVAPGTDAAPEWVRLGGLSWVAIREELERSGQSIALWIHTHSLAALAARPSADGEPVEEPPDGARPTSGLFLSGPDRASARATFRAPWMTCAVLDSDAVGRHAAGAALPLGDRLGLWGWSEGHLVPRSAWLVG